MNILLERSIIMLQTKKVGIVGIGHVGSHCALAMLLQGVCDEMVLMDILPEKAKGYAIDCMDTVSFLPHRTIIKDGGVKELSEMDVIVISVGSLTKNNQRLEELKGSMEAIKSFVPDVVKAGFNGIFVVITNPVDIVTYFVRQLSGFPKHRVIGTGTGLDSARLRRILSETTNIDSHVIQAFMLGEHGDTQVANYSSATIHGVPFLDYVKTHPEQFKDVDLLDLEKQVVRTAWDIIAGKGSTEFGIGCTCANLVKAIFHNERRVLPCSAYLEGEYGQSGFYTGVPAIIGNNGVEEILELPLNEREEKRFKEACEVMKKYIEIGNSYGIC